MNQQEKDWLDLGRQLKDYQPDGNPEVDFLDFQQLQTKEKTRRAVWWYSGFLLPLLLLLFSVGFYWYETPVTNNAVRETTLFAEAGQSVSAPTIAPAIAAQPPPVSPPISDAVTQAKVNTQRLKGAALMAMASSNVKEPVSLVPVSNEPVQDLGQSSSFIGPEESIVGEENVPPKIVAAVTALAAQSVSELPTGTEIPDFLIQTTTKKNHLRFTLGAGLSNHWRGEGFLQDVDRGLYANVGIYQPLGRRFGLEGQLGYRGHNMQFPVLSDAKKPWSYHKDEIHNTGHMGQERVYIYEGIVEGYRAAEFSLLVHYQLHRKVGVHAGGRYSLPSIKFRRVVHGPDNENPFHDFIEGQEIVKYKDYGAIMGLKYRLTNHLSLQGELHLGMVDLIENAAQEGDRFNRSNSLSVGLRYLID